MKNRIDSSRRKTPWDQKQELSITQNFIIQKYNNNYHNKHQSLLETNEDVLINNIDIKFCKICNSKDIIKKGKTKNNIQQYYCKECNLKFTPLKNTIFENHKIPISEWIEFILSIANYGSLTLTSKVNKNSITTTIYWLNKMFLLVKNWQNNIILKGDIYIDEMFYTVKKSDIKTKNGKKLRGLSRNKYCICVGYDGTNIIAVVKGLGKPSTKKIYEVFSEHIQSNSTLIHDDEKSHNKLVENLKLNSESYDSTYLKTKSDDDNPLRPINHLIDLIRQFLNSHSGFDRDDLQNYLNLFCFLYSGHKNKLEKVEELLELALKSDKNLKYRDLYVENIREH